MQSGNFVQGSSGGLSFMLVQYVPTILAAIIVFVIGWIIAILLYRVVVAIVRVLRIDDLMRSAGIDEAVRESGFRLDTGKFLGTLVMWFVIIAFLSAALDMLGLMRVTLFLEQVVLWYLPNVFVAALIIVLAAIFAEAVRGLITGSARAAGAHHGANFAGVLAKWAIWVFAVMAALNQLGIASDFLQTLFTGVVIAVSLGFGLAFGLGGRDAAAEVIARVRREIGHSQE
jgi:hypothetical protein